MQNKILALLACLALGACTRTMTVPVVTNDPPVAIPQVQPITVLPVQWQVLNTRGVEALSHKLQTNKGAQVVLFALDPDNFRNLSLNLNDIERYVKDQHAVVIMLSNIVERRSGSHARTARTTPVSAKQTSHATAQARLAAAAIMAQKSVATAEKAGSAASK